MVRGRSGGSSVRWPLVTFLRIRRPRGRKGERRAASMPAQTRRCGCAAGRAGQFLKKVNWNGSPMKISRPPGIVGSERVKGVQRSPGRLGALAPPVHLPVVDADLAGEAAPGEAGGLLEPYEAAGGSPSAAGGRRSGAAGRPGSGPAPVETGRIVSLVGHRNPPV